MQKQSGLDSIAIIAKPEITRFRNNRAAAISLQFDDSMASQLKNAVPLLAKHRTIATFFINPGAGHYAPHRLEWEKEIVRAGHEVGNHTLTHKGATSVAEADTEIKGCASVFSQIYANRPRLLPFAKPGGVKWELSRAEEDAILAKYLLFPTPNRVFFMDGSGNPDPRAIPEQAIKSGTWVQLGMHGVEGEWLSTSVANLSRLLDFLDTHSNELWTATTGAVHKYVVARDAALPVRLSDVSVKGFTATVACDTSKVNTYGLPFTTIYDEPLTIRVPVPTSWHSIRVIQNKTRSENKTMVVNAQTIAQFDALPNAGPVRAERS